jgi:4-hydroxy-tetrahydrodipicolinate synthase
MTQYAEKIGADAALIVVPYYNKPTQEGLYQHYKAVAASTRLPIIVYNVPSRCVTDIMPETIARVKKDCPNIIGVKDATNDRTRVRRTIEICGPDFTQLSGEDASVALFLQEGGHGCISVTANAAPAALAALHNAWAAHDRDTFDAITRKLAPLHRALFVETSPAPVKYACSRLGFGTDSVRLPLVKASPEARQAVDDALIAAGLLTQAQTDQPCAVHA